MKKLYMLILVFLPTFLLGQKAYFKKIKKFRANVLFELKCDSSLQSTKIYSISNTYILGNSINLLDTFSVFSYRKIAQIENQNLKYKKNNKLKKDGFINQIREFYEIHHDSLTMGHFEEYIKGDIYRSEKGRVYIGYKIEFNGLVIKNLAFTRKKSNTISCDLHFQNPFLLVKKYTGFKSARFTDNDLELLRLSFNENSYLRFDFCE